jgi:glycosyltransferase involved in cell wall biosynthesis
MERGMMKISVILCTYNRCRSLSKTLESISCSKLPKAIDWDVLVVDNNSCDQTRPVVEEFCHRHPRRFRYLFEPRPGKSNALTTGIREASGDILVFTDDDVTVEPTWLQNLTANLHNREWAGTGGRTLPVPSFLRPQWLVVDERTLATLGCFDRGLDSIELTEPPFGNNMAYRKEMFEKHGGFLTDLGPRPGSLIRSEDTEFGLRLLAAGERLRYEPSAVVYHSVPENRITKDYFLSWWFDKARADIRASGSEPRARWYFAGIPLVLMRRLAVWTLRWICTVEPSGRFSNKVKVWFVAGQILECYNQALSKRRQRKHLLVDDPAISSPQGPKTS